MDENERMLSTKDELGFDTLNTGAFDDWNSFSQENDPAKWAIPDHSTFGAPVLALHTSPISRGSFALNLEGFDSKMMSPSSNHNHGLKLRRSSSFTSLRDQSKRGSVCTFMSSGDASFDDALDLFFKKKDTGRSKENDMATNDNIPAEKEVRRPPDKARHKKGICRSKTTDGMVRSSAIATPSSSTKEPHHRKPKRTHTTGGGPWMTDESEGTIKSRNNSKNAVMKDESNRERQTSRRTKHHHKSHIAMKEDSIITTTSRVRDDRRQSRERKSISPKRTKTRKERSSAAARLHTTSGSIASNNSRLNKSSTSLDTTTGVGPGIQRTASLHDEKINEHGSNTDSRASADRPVVKAVANLLNQDDFGLGATDLHRAESQDSEMESSGRTHGSGRTHDSKSARLTKRSHKSPSRSPSRSKGSPKMGQRDRSRSNSSSRKNKTAEAAPLLGDKSEHSESELDDIDSLFATPSHRNRPSRRGNESFQEASHKKSKGKVIRRIKSADGSPFSLTRDRFAEDRSHVRRGRRTGSVETKARGRRTGSVETRDRSSETPRRRRSGSMEAPRPRRTGSVEAPRRRDESVEPRGRRTHSVEAKSRNRGASVEPRTGRGESAGARGRRTHSVDANRRMRETQQEQAVAATPSCCRSHTTAEAKSSSADQQCLARSKTTAGVTRVGGKETDVAMPSISGMTGGEVTWKVRKNKPKPQPLDQDAFKEPSQKEVKKGRRFTQAVWKDKIKEAKSR